jgi:peptidase E
VREPILSGPVFLAGGGSPEQSARVDAAFVDCCRPDLPLVYIPNAFRSQSASESLTWFTSIMAPLGVSQIDMWDHLQPQRSPQDIGGVYLGGGDTLYLIEELLRAGFDEYLWSASQAGIPIYGASAGAIVLGETLATSKAVIAEGRVSMTGLSLIPRHAVACHYRPDDGQRLAELARHEQLTIIAVAEDGGAKFTDGSVTNIGSTPVSLFGSDGSISRA